MQLTEKNHATTIEKVKQIYFLYLKKKISS